MGALWTLDKAASELNIPRAALHREADRHGLLVRFGRSVRIDPETIPELIEKCRSVPKAPVSTGTRPKDAGSFETLADQKLQQALQAAQMLKKGSRSTSQNGTGRVVPLGLKG